MKRLVAVSGILSALLLLASCYMMSVRSTGTISLNLGTPASRAIEPTADVRVYLYTYSSPTAHGLYTFPGGKEFIEFSYGTGTQTLTGIPIGLWQVLVSVGSHGPSGSDAFYVKAYGASAVINVAGGTESSASVTTKAAPFAYSPLLAGHSLKSVIYDYTNSLSSDYPVLIAATDSTLYEIGPSLSAGAFDLTADQPTAVGGLPSGIRINSLSQGLGTAATGGQYSCLFVNGNYGILPYAAVIQSAFDTAYSTTLTDPDGNSLDVLDAAAVSDSSGNVVVYYRRAHDIGGVYLSGSNYFPYNGTSGAQWVKDPGFSNSANNPSVLALAVDPFSPAPGDAYFATTAGAFRASPSLVTYPNSSLAGNVVYFTAPDNEPIQALAVDGADNVIYIGTPKGAYYADLNEGNPDSVVSGSWKPIPETIGDGIVSIKLDKSASYVSQQTLTQAVALRSRYNLYTLPGPPSLGGTVTTLPFYAGLPGKLNGMDFANGTLFLAGSLGLASVPVGNLQAALPPA